MKTRLTELGVSKLRPPKSGKYSWHPDALLPSFGLRVYRTGLKAWGITRRWNGAKHPTFRKIGDHPALSLAAARTRAREILAGGGGNATTSGGGGKVTTSFAALAEQFLQHGRTKRGRELRPATVKEYRRALLIYAHRLHARPVTAIRRADISTLIDHVATTSGATTAMRTRAALSRFYSWLIARDKVEANVVSGTEGYDVLKRSRVLSDGELAALWTATEAAGDFNLIVRLCLWTGCRRSEAGGLRWSELVDGVWLIPGTRTKNHRPLALPMPAQMRAALEAHPRWVGRDLVFGRGPTGFQAWSKSKERLDAKLGFNQAWDLHDIRRSVQTRMIALGINRDVVNRVLNHAMGPIDAAYDQHHYLPEKAAALQTWADELERIVEQCAAKVVALKRIPA